MQLRRHGYVLSQQTIRLIIGCATLSDVTKLFAPSIVMYSIRGVDLNNTITFELLLENTENKI